MVPEEDAEAFAIVVLYFLQRRPYNRARETFEVAKFLELNRSICVTANMRRFRAGAAIDGFSRRSCTKIKEDDAGTERNEEDGADEEEGKRASHVLEVIGIEKETNVAR
jgi:hypothetical protein